MSHKKDGFVAAQLSNNEEKDLNCYISLLDELDNYIDELDIWLKPKREVLWGHAQKIHDNYLIYYFYALLDSLNLSFSLIKNLFDLIVPANNVGFMHHMMMTTGGIIAISIAAVILVTWSLLATAFDKKKTPEELEEQKKLALAGSQQQTEDAFDIEIIKTIISTGWVYVRELLQALKYAYKGMRNLYSLITEGKRPTELLTTVSAPIAVLVIINRLVLRWIRESRKKMMKKNKDLLKAIHTLEENRQTLDLDQYEQELQDIKEKKIAAQSDFIQFIVYPMVIFGGVSDSLYLYFGFFTLAPLGVLLYPLVFICVCYSLMAILSRSFEEYQYQQTLEITQLEIRLTFLNIEIFELFEQIKNAKTETEKAELQEDHQRKLEQFSEHRKRIEDLATPTYWGVIIIGIKNGLAINGAVNSAVALLAAILTLTSTAFPPALLGAVLGLGLLWLVVGISYSILEDRHRQRIQRESGELEVKKMLNNISKLEQDSTTYKQSLDAASTYSPPPPAKLHSYFEVFRCLFSAQKGQKLIDNTLNPWQESDGKGHYTDPSWMLVIAGVMGLLTSIVLGLRAFAKEFKDLPLSKADNSGKTSTATHSSSAHVGFFAPINDDGPKLIVLEEPIDKSPMHIS